MEACVFCVDNSDFMRNGDYAPSRFQAQNDAVQNLVHAKLDRNQESLVALVSTAGKRVTVHHTLSREVGAIMHALATEVQCEGRANIVGALKTAQLCLKNRLNKSQRQRVVLFVGSPVEEDARQLEALAAQLKKAGVNVDVVNFGTENQQNENAEKLEAFINKVNNNGGSHLVHIPPGPHLLSDMVLSSVVATGAAAAPGAGGVSTVGAPAAPAGAAAAFGGVDPNLDPELAMALRMSMEEERLRQEAAMRQAVDASRAVAPAAGAAAPASAAAAAASSSASASSSAAAAPASAAAPAAQAAAAGSAMVDEDDDAMLQQALMMSMASETNETVGVPPTPPGPAPVPTAPAGAANKPEAGAAAAAGAGAAAAAAARPAAAQEPDLAAALQDPDVIHNLLGSVGLNPGDVDIDDLLEQVTEQPQGDAPKDGAKKKGEEPKKK